jgi:hypothetical protein
MSASKFQNKPKNLITDLFTVGRTHSNVHRETISAYLSALSCELISVISELLQMSIGVYKINYLNR